MTDNAMIVGFAQSETHVVNDGPVSILHYTGEPTNEFHGEDFNILPSDEIIPGSVLLAVNSKGWADVAVAPKDNILVIGLKDDDENQKLVFLEFSQEISPDSFHVPRPENPEEVGLTEDQVEGIELFNISFTGEESTSSIHDYLSE